VRRIGKMLLAAVSVTLMLALTTTTVQALQQHQSPKQALAQAPKETVKAIANTVKKVVKPEEKTEQPETAATRSTNEPAAPASKQADQAQPFIVQENGKPLGTFDTFVSAVAFAKLQPDAQIKYGPHSTVIWAKSSASGSGSVRMDLPLIEQMPDLERGCEVTSLAMLLQSDGIDADKLTLAEQIKKDPTPFEQDDDGLVHFGNPNRGFVGDMKSFDNPGFGVYHGPIRELAEKYMPGRVIDATGADFADLYSFLDNGIPVWTIVNMDYDTLSEDEFEQWMTPDGPIDITYKEHSVLVTGYDDEYIYINDPLNETDKVEKNSFIAAWEQMGKQAITYVPKSETKAGNS